MRDRKYTAYGVSFQQFVPGEAEMHVKHRGREYLGTLDAKEKKLVVREWTFGGVEWKNDHMSKSAAESMMFKLGEKGFDIDKIKLVKIDAK